MHKTNTTSWRQVVVHTGIGVQNYCIRDEGAFQVWYGREKKDFKVLIAAYYFYLALGVSASLWDITDGDMLVEAKCYVA